MQLGLVDIRKKTFHRLWLVVMEGNQEQRQRQPFTGFVAGQGIKLTTMEIMIKKSRSISLIILKH